MRQRRSRAGEAADTPGGAVHAQLQRIQRQLSAVQGGGDVAAVQHRSMLTPPAAATPPAATLPRLTPVPLSRPATAASLPRPGTASTVATNRTPLSALNSVANEQGEFWHRRCAVSDSVTVADVQPFKLCTSLCGLIHCTGRPSFGHFRPFAGGGLQARALPGRRPKKAGLCRRFEEQAVRLSTTEAEKRDLEIRLARAGAPVRSQGTPRTAAARTPVSRRVTIGGAGTASRCALLSPCMVGEAEAAAATGGAAAAAPEASPGPDVKRKIAFDDTEGEKRAAPSPHVECSGSRENVGADVNLAAPPRSGACCLSVCCTGSAPATRACMACLCACSDGTQNACRNRSRCALLLTVWCESCRRQPDTSIRAVKAAYTARKVALKWRARQWAAIQRCGKRCRRRFVRGSQALRAFSSARSVWEVGTEACQKADGIALGLRQWHGVPAGRVRVGMHC